MELYRRVQMLSKHTINLEYAKWFENQINDFIDPIGCKDILTNKYLSENGFFITFGFDRNRVASRKSSDDYMNRDRGSVEFDNFNHFYNLICKGLLGRNFMKPPYHEMRPLVIACADAQGSRLWRSLGPLENIHLHTLWVLKPQHSRLLHEVFDEVQSSKGYNVFDFGKIDVRPIDRFESKNGKCSQLTSYLSKFVAFNTAEASIAEDVRIYPTPIQ